MKPVVLISEPIPKSRQTWSRLGRNRTDSSTPVVHLNNLNITIPLLYTTSRILMFWLQHQLRTMVESVTHLISSSADPRAIYVLKSNAVRNYTADNSFLGIVSDIIPNWDILCKQNLGTCISGRSTRPLNISFQIPGSSLSNTSSHSLPFRVPITSFLLSFTCSKKPQG